MPSPTLRGYSFMITGGLLVLAGLGGIGYPLSLVLGILVLGHVYLSYVLASAYEASLASARIERRPEKTYVQEGSEVTVTVRIAEETGRGVPRIVVEESLPERVALSRGSTKYAASLPSGEETLVRYAVRPLIGMHVFGPLRIRGGDVLGLFSYTASFKAKASIRAYPAYEDLLRERFHSAIPYMGVSRSRRRGPGYDYYELRDYEPGDDVRRIVWTASARLGRLIVREDEAETRLRVMLLIDASSASWLGPPGDAPIDHMARAASMIAASIARRGGQVGYLLYDGLGWQSRAPAPGTRRLDELLYALSSLVPPRHRGVYRLGDAVEEAAAYAGGGLLIMLMGWMTLRGYEASKILDAVGPLRGRAILAVVLPGRSASDPLALAAKRLEAWWFRKNRGRLVEGGVIPLISEGWETMHVLLAAAGRLVERYASA